MAVPRLSCRPARPTRATLNHLRRRRLVAAGLATTAAGRPGAAQAPWPQRPLRLLVGVPPGGGVDIIARLVAAQLADRLGQPVVVENRAGASGNLAMEAVARAPRDGLTLFFGNTGQLAINNEIFPALGIDTLRDLEPVALIAENFFFFVTARRLPVTTLAEFIAHARAHPGRLTFGSTGVGSAHQLAFEMFRRPLGLDIVHVPYRGAAPAIQDFMAGNLDLYLDGHGSIEPLLSGGQGRLLAHSAPARLPWLPDTPTVAEAAPLPGYQVTGWMAVMAPAATPPEILARLEAETRVVLRPDGLVAQALAGRGVTARFRDGAATRAIIAAERAQWRRVIREAGITAQD
jgi:tripartite-type tricarboxylate transporter receptor subunit TctC